MKPLDAAMAAVEEALYDEVRFGGQSRTVRVPPEWFALFASSCVAIHGWPPPSPTWPCLRIASSYGPAYLTPDARLCEAAVMG